MRFVVLTAWATALIGCGAPSCTFVAIKIAPQAATVDHTAAPPANGLQFSVISATTPPGCGVMHGNPAKVSWSVSDSIHASISNAHGAMNGTATCLGATTGVATVTAAMPSGGSRLTGTAKLTCQ